MDKFNKIMQFVFEAEGGYSNDLKDPGGETNWGISKRAHPSLDIANLTKEQALAIYKEEYWCPIGGDSLDFPMAACMMDTAVNMGVNRAVNLRKQTDDWKRFLELRSVFYLNLIDKKPELKVYKNGWLGRINRLKTFILAETN